MAGKILVIDDDRDILSILEIILEEEGFETVLRRAGITASELAEINPDLVLLDVRIDGFPKLGTELCREYKAVNALAHVPVLLFSAEPALETLTANSGADGFVIKPFDITSLLKKIREFVT
jgi:two-component system, OmpR family, response regulator VicR